MVEYWKCSLYDQEQDKNADFYSKLVEVLANVIGQKKIIERQKQNCHCSKVIYVGNSKDL